MLLLASRSVRAEEAGEPPAPSPDSTETSSEPSPRQDQDGAAEPPPTAGSAATPPSTSEPLSDPRLEQAREIIARGEGLFADGNFAAATVEFEHAYQLLEGHPSQYIVLHNMGLCNERMFQYDEALEYYQQYLDRAPESEPDRKEVQAVVRTLRALLSTLQIESNVGAQVWVDDRFVAEAPGQVSVPSGRHAVELRAKGYESARQEVTVAAQQTRELHFELEQLSNYRGPEPGYFWSSVAFTGAATVTGSVLGVVTLFARQDAKDSARLNLPRLEHDKRRVRQLALATDVAFGSALVFGATSTLLYFVTDWRRVPESGVELGVTAQSWELSYQGAF